MKNSKNTKPLDNKFHQGKGTGRHIAQFVLDPNEK